MGEVPIRRAYADASHLPGWSKVPGLRLIQSGTGKNSTDLLMTIDAMELALHGKVERFILASSDGDFSHLALRLREYGLEVVGIGGPQTPAMFRQACSGFEVLPLVEATEAAPKPPKPPVPELSRIDEAVAEVLGRNGGQLPISRLGSLMGNSAQMGDKTTKAKDLSGKSWPKYLAARPEHYRLSGSGTSAMVRLVPRLAAVS